MEKIKFRSSDSRIFLWYERPMDVLHDLNSTKAFIYETLLIWFWKNKYLYSDYKFNEATYFKKNFDTPILIGLQQLYTISV